MAKLAGYDFVIDYKRGMNNKSAHALSSEEELALNILSNVSTDLLQRIKDSWNADETFCLFITELQNGFVSHPEYNWNNGQLKRQGKLVVGQDPKLRRTIIKLYHLISLGGHSGVHVTTQKISSLFY